MNVILTIDKIHSTMEGSGLMWVKPGLWNLVSYDPGMLVLHGWGF